MFKYRIIVWERCYPSYRSLNYYFIDIPGHNGEIKYGRKFPKDKYEEIVGWDRRCKMRRLCVLFDEEDMPFQQACKVMNLECLQQATWLYTKLTKSEVNLLSKEEMSGILQSFTKLNYLR